MSQLGGHVNVRESVIKRSQIVRVNIRRLLKDIRNVGRWRFGWLETTFIGLVALALGMRLWELTGRAMHYDEAIHLHYAWRLSVGQGFFHAPWMHGPFQIELVSLIFRLFGDSDFTGRLGYACFGAMLVGLPYFLRDYLGRAGAIFSATMLALSPSLLYFSRFGRNDIIMAFWVTALLILMWRYVHDEKNRYLYMAAAVLALMFATKESAYIIIFVFGFILLFLSLPALVPLAFGRVRFADLVGPAGFLLLLVTLTLPQWSAGIGWAAQDALGLELVNPEGVTNGIVGAPQWIEPLVILPVYDISWWQHLFGVALVLGGAVLFGLYRKATMRTLVNVGGAPVLVVVASFLFVFHPIDLMFSAVTSALWADVPVSVAFVLLAIWLLIYQRCSWERGVWVLIIPFMLSLLYAVAFTSVVDVDVLINGLLPTGIPLALTSTDGIPVNYLLAGGVLVAMFLVSLYLGLRWKGGIWLLCAIIFYGVWISLYTTLFTNWAGVFSGIWQGFGYWAVQQDVARGNQPWYYYFVGISVYELLPVLFGGLGAIYFLKKGDVFGLVLAVWSGLTLLIYTIASEKMPWLLVNVSLPFILLSGKYLGVLLDRVCWRRVLRELHVLILILPPLGVIAIVYILLRYLDPDSEFTTLQWGILTGVLLLAIGVAYMVRRARAPTGRALMGLGLAGLLLGFGAWGGLRAAYTYDDSSRELLVYAQGSSDLPETFRELNEKVFGNNYLKPMVVVDREMWYPFNWYLRNQQKNGAVRFACFKDESGQGTNADCNPLSEEPNELVLLLTRAHGDRDLEYLAEYQRGGPFRNLIWYPESYRRDGEDRPNEGLIEEIREDIKYFKHTATSRESWQGVLKFLLFRELDDDWYRSEYYDFIRQ
jgi:hypothetical protein